MEEDIPDYDMDSEDEKWLVAHSKVMDITALKVINNTKQFFFVVILFFRGGGLVHASNISNHQIFIEHCFVFLVV